MKKTQWIELIRKIRSSFVSFFAIFIFVTCAVALFGGIGWCQKSLSLSLDKEFDNDKLHDIQIVLPLGADESDLNRFKEHEDVSDADGQYTSFQYFRWNEENLQAKISSVAENMDQLVVIEGRLPETLNEIVVDENWAGKNGVHLGDVITFSHDEDGKSHLLHGILTENLSEISHLSEDGMQYFITDHFVVSGFVYSPEYTSILSASYVSSPRFSTPVDCLMFAKKEAFDSLAYNGYNTILIRSNQLRNMPTSSDSYKQKAREIGAKLKPLADEITQNKYELISNAINHYVGTPLENIAKSVEEELPQQMSTILLREHNGSIVMSDFLGEMFQKLKYNLALIFAIIGVFICYSTILRLIYKDTVLIGTKKAMGFTNREVISPYLLYALIATVLGVMLGLLLAVFAVEPLLIGVMKNTFRFGAAVYHFSFGEAAIYFLVETVIMVFFAFVSYIRILRRDIAGLLSGIKPPVKRLCFYEKTKIWKKLHLLTKSVIINFASDKRRVMATLIGIMGCTILLVSSLSFEFSVTGSLPKQFSKIQQYDTVVYFNPDNEGCDGEIKMTISGVTQKYSEVYSSNIAIKAPTEELLPSFLMVGDDNFNNLFSLYRLNGSVGSLDEGAWISCSFANYYHLNEGDEITFLDSESAERKVKIAGICEYYLQCPRLMMSKEQYELIFGESLEKNAFIVSSEGRQAKDFDNLLKGINGYVCTTDFYTYAQSAQKTIELVTTACMSLYIVLSTIIAFFVILDLLVMFVEERKKELITLMINGYTTKETSKYIYIDTLLMMIFGILFGIIGGVLLGYWDVISLESKMSYFLHEISFLAIGIGASISALFTICMTLIALKRISNFELTDLNKE